jgi:N,N'-diacetylchitobiose transport system substrate-binding protein
MRSKPATRRFGIAAIAAAVLAVAGCGSGGGGGQAPSGADRTLNLWIMEGTNPDPKPFFAELSAAFTAKTGAKLDVQYVQWKAAKDKFATAMAGGTTPDVAEVGTTWVGEFGDAGALVDLSSRV